MKKSTFILFLLIHSISGYCQTYTGDLTLSTQAQIDSFNYTAVVGDLIIESTWPDPAVNLLGLNTLAYVSGDFSIINNSYLTSLNGLENLDSVGGHLDIKSNSSITSVNGLNSLTKINGHFYIYANGQVSSLKALKKLTYVGDFMGIYYSKLNSLDGLENLLFVGGLLAVQSNNYLVDYCGILPLISVNSSQAKYSIANNLRVPKGVPGILDNCSGRKSFYEINYEDFDTIFLGDYETKNIEIKNSEDTTIVIIAIGKTDNAGDFALLGVQDSITLAPSQTFNFLVRLNANSLGAKEMTLHIESDASSTVEDYVISGTVVSPPSLDVFVPATPNAVVIDKNSIRVSWQKSNDALSYRLYKNTSIGTKEQVYWGAADSYFDSELEAETEYTYSLLSENAGGLSLSSAEVSATTLAEATTLTPKADLTPVLLSPDIIDKWVEGGEYDVSIALHNKGEVASASTLARLSLSKTGEYSANDYVLKDNILFEPINPSQTSFAKAVIKIPDFSAGEYYLVLNTDAQNSENDQDVSNNVKTSNEKFTVYPSNSILKPDLVPRFTTTPSSIVKGEENVIGISISNVGNDYADVFNGQLFLSKDRYLSSDDIALGNKKYHNDIDEDVARVEDITFTIPSTVNTGKYYLVYDIDPEDEIGELYEQNNAVSSAEIIEVLTNGTVEIKGRIRTVNSLYGDDVGLSGVRILGLPGMVFTNSDGRYTAKVPEGWSGKLSVETLQYIATTTVENAGVLVNVTSDKIVDFKALDPFLLFEDISSRTKLLPDDLKNIIGSDLLSIVGDNIESNPLKVLDMINKADDIYVILRSDEDDIARYFVAAKLITGTVGGPFSIAATAYIYVASELYAELDKAFVKVAEWHFANLPEEVKFNISIEANNYFIVRKYVSPSDYQPYLHVKMLAVTIDDDGKNEIISTRVLTDVNTSIVNRNELRVIGGSFSEIADQPAKFNFDEDTKFYVELSWIDDNGDLVQRMLLPFTEPFVKRLSLTVDTYKIKFRTERGSVLKFNKGASFLKIKQQ